MTVNTTSIATAPYAGNGVGTSFNYTWRITDKSQVKVIETTDLGVESTLTVDTDYTVSGINTDSGGSITRTAGALPTGYTWYVRSNFTATQETDFDSQGAFLPSVHEAAIDKLTFLAQQQADEGGRSLKVSETSTQTPEELLQTIYDAQTNSAASAQSASDYADQTALDVIATAANKTAASTSANEAAESAAQAGASFESLYAAGDIGGGADQVARGNHSHSDLIAAINNREPADPSILKDADIGENVQAYDADIVKAPNGVLPPLDGSGLINLPPSDVDPLANAVAWGYIKNVAGVQTLISSFGVASFSVSGSIFTVNLADDMSDSDYSVGVNSAYSSATYGYAPLLDSTAMTVNSFKFGSIYYAVNQGSIFFVFGSKA